MLACKGAPSPRAYHHTTTDGSALCAFCPGSPQGGTPGSRHPGSPSSCRRPAAPSVATDGCACSITAACRPPQQAAQLGCSVLGWLRCSRASSQLRGVLRNLTWEKRLLDLKAAAYRLHVARLPGIGSSALIADPFSRPLYTTLICRERRDREERLPRGCRARASEDDLAVQTPGSGS